jgi:hypothetical protein
MSEPLTEAEESAIERAAAKAAGEGLTPVELAAATAMADKQNQDDLAAGYGAAAMPGDFAGEARAVVAAVRPILAAEALWDAAEALDKRCGSAPLGTIDGLILACNELAEMSAALRTTTPEEEN